MLELYGEDVGVKIARKHLGWYTKGLPGSAEFRNRVNFIDDVRTVLDELDRFYEAVPDIAGRVSTAKSAVAAPPLEAQLGAMVFAVLLLDGDDVIQQANPASEEMLGSSASRLIGRPFNRAVRISDRRVERSFAEHDTRLIARGISIETNGGERAVNLTSSPMPAFPGWRVLTLSDVGQAALEIAEERVPISAPSVLAHEIKNPLCAIRGASQLLERRSDERSRPARPHNFARGRPDRRADRPDAATR